MALVRSRSVLLLARRLRLWAVVAGVMALGVVGSPVVAQVSSDQSTISGTVSVSYAPPGVSGVRVTVRCKDLLNATAGPVETSAVFPVAGGKADYRFAVGAGSSCGAKVELLGPTGVVVTGLRAKTSVSFGTAVLGADVSMVAGVYDPVSAPVPAATQGVIVAGGNGPGAGLSQFTVPYGVAVDGAGNVFVADFSNHRVVRWAPGAAAGVVVAGGNGSGSALNQTRFPVGVAVDGAGNVFVAEYANHRVVRWAPGAAAGVVVAGGNGNGSALNQLGYPIGVVVDGSGNVYVAEGANDRVTRWAPGATSGVVVAGGNGRGPALNQLNFPYGVAVDGSGNVYAADYDNHRVVRWAPGAAAGVVVAGDNGFGSGLNQLAFPDGVAVDGAGNVYVADTFNHRVVRWAPGATQGVVVAGGNGNGPALNQFDIPFGVAVDGSGNVFVADVNNRRVVRWFLGSVGSSVWVPVSGSVGLDVRVDFPPSVRVAKSLVGAEVVAGSSYAVAVKCRDAAGTVLGLNPAGGFTTADDTRIVSLRAGGSVYVTGADFAGFDVGAQCFAVELDSGGGSVSYSSTTASGVAQPGELDAVRCLDRVGGVVVGVAEGGCGAAVGGTGTGPAGVFRSVWTAGGQSVTVTNANTGSLVVTKAVTGDPRSNIATYEINVNCNNGGPRDTFLLKDRQSKTFTDIPVGASCVVSETRTDGAVSRIVDNSGDNTTDGRVVIVRPVTGCAQLGSTGTGCDAVVTIVNDYNTTPAIAGDTNGPAPVLASASTTTVPAVTAAPATPIDATPDYTG